LQNFHLTPSRILHRINSADTLPGLFIRSNLVIFGTKRLLVIEKDTRFNPAAHKINIDLVILSKNPRLYLKDLLSAIDCRQIVIDSSNPIWKVTQWQKDCKAAGIACHSVSINGAFVMNLP
jgi:competence protein ComEC